MPHRKDRTRSASRTIRRCRVFAKGFEQGETMSITVSSGGDLTVGEFVGREKITNISADKIIQVNPEEGAVVNIVQDTPPEPQLRTVIAEAPRVPSGFVDRETELTRLDQGIAAHEAVVIFA